MEIKETIDKLEKAFDDFKALNDEAIKNGGAESKAAMEKANGEITALRTSFDEQTVAFKEMENQLARADFNQNAPQSDRQRREAGYASEFLALTGQTPVHVDDVGQEQIQAFRGYKRAFESYLRVDDKGGLAPEFRDALSVGSDPNGGYWVPPDTSGRIVEFVHESSPIRELADVQPTGTSPLEGSYDLDEAAGGWVGETESRSETDTPDIGEWSIPVQEQHASPRSTQNMLDDADRDVESWLIGKVGRKFGRMEATSAHSGDGVKQMRGFLTYTSGTPTIADFERIQQVITGVDGDFAVAPAGGDVFIDTVGAMKVDLRNGMVWAMSRLTEAAVRKEKDGDGAYVWQPDFAAGGSPLINGYPVRLFEDMPEIASDSISIALANFKEAYTIADRQGIRVLRDPFTAKPNVIFYSTRRVGGGVTNFEAIKLIQFAD